MRQKLLGVVVLLVAMTAAWAVARVDAVRRVVLPGPPAGEVQLTRPVGELRIDGVNFEQALDILRQRTGAKITMDRQALALGPESRSEALARPLGLHVRDMTLDQVLHRLCAAVDPEYLDYVADGEGIVITTPAGLARYTYVRSYDIDDVLPPPGAPTRLKEYPYGLFGHQQQQRRLTAKWNQPKQRQDYVEDVIHTITDMVSTDQWKDNGGNVASIQVIGGRLIVRQTPANQREIARLLDGLRQAQERTAAGQNGRED